MTDVPNCWRNAAGMYPKPSSPQPVPHEFFTMK